eukprot:snap_masked-scaffold_13-processed-gene-9.19-mRNA-1 protein AED:1.00 eAED:1.00 QI:0/-1/0/0/-1/1/1/0/322
MREKDQQFRSLSIDVSPAKSASRLPRFKKIPASTGSFSQPTSRLFIRRQVTGTPLRARKTAKTTSVRKKKDKGRRRSSSLGLIEQNFYSFDSARPVNVEQLKQILAATEFKSKEDKIKRLSSHMVTPPRIPKNYISEICASEKKKALNVQRDLRSELSDGPVFHHNNSAEEKSSSEYAVDTISETESEEMDEIERMLSSANELLKREVDKAKRRKSTGTSFMTNRTSFTSTTLASPLAKTMNKENDIHKLELKRASMVSILCCFISSVLQFVGFLFIAWNVFVLLVHISHADAEVIRTIQLNPQETLFLLNIEFDFLKYLNG